MTKQESLPVTYGEEKRISARSSLSIAVLTVLRVLGCSPCAQTGRASGTEQAVGRVLGSLCAITARDEDAQSAMLASWISQVRGSLVGSGWGTHLLGSACMHALCERALELPGIH